MSKKNNYSYFDKYLLRTPINAFNFKEICNINFEEIKEIFQKDIIFRESIFLASKALYHEVNKLLKENKNDEKILNSLLKYIIRSKTRSTPFGLFAGYCLGTVSNSTEIILNKREKYEKYTRFDMELVCRIATYVSLIDEVRKKIKFYPNNSIYSVGDLLSYIEYRNVEKGRTYFKSSVEKDEYIMMLLSFSKKGKYIADLIDLFDKEGFSEEESREFINDLIDNQILVSDLDVSTIDVNPFSTLIDKLENLQINNDEINILIKRGKELLNYFSSNEIQRDDIKTINIIDETFSFIGYNQNNVLQTDLKLTAIKNTLSKQTLSKINEGINVLNIFSTQINSDLEEFKRTFYDKYEEREIPLLRALDDDMGIGYPVERDNLLSPLLDDLNFPAMINHYSVVDWSYKDSFIADKISDFYLNNEDELEIFEKELDDSEGLNVMLPNTLSSIVEIYTNNAEEEEIYVPNFTASAANLLGRFSSSDEELRKFIKEEIIHKEESFLNENAIFAEILHLPETKVGNIILRPSFTDYELPILLTSNLELENQIALEDLTLLMRNGVLILKSEKLNKRIIPRLSNAHNYSFAKNLSIYKFLCDLHYQNVKRVFRFDWGVLGETMKYLPRVRYKNLILSKAFWNFNLIDLKHFYKISDEELMSKIKEWKKIYRIPDNIVLRDFDNKLFINMNNLTLVKLFLDTVRNRETIKIEEILFSEKNTIVKDENNQKYFNEFVVSFYKNK